MSAVANVVHIVVEVTKNDKRKLEFEHAEVTGREIKTQAGVPADSDLARRVEGKLVFVTDDQVIRIADGEHFVALPPGTIS